MILNGFIRVTVIVGVLTFLVTFFYLFHWRLTFVTLLPTIFSLVCTFGTLRLLGQPLGIPVIMVAVVVIGMGTDYALYLVRAHQRYLDEHHPSVSLIRLSVLIFLFHHLHRFRGPGSFRSGPAQDRRLSPGPGDRLFLPGHHRLRAAPPEENPYPGQAWSNPGGAGVQATLLANPWPIPAS